MTSQRTVEESAKGDMDGQESNSRPTYQIKVLECNCLRLSSDPSKCKTRSVVLEFSQFVVDDHYVSRFPCKTFIAFFLHYDFRVGNFRTYLRNRFVGWFSRERPDTIWFWNRGLNFILGYDVIGIISPRPALSFSSWLTSKGEVIPS